MHLPRSLAALLPLFNPDTQRPLSQPGDQVTFSLAHAHQTVFTNGTSKPLTLFADTSLSALADVDPPRIKTRWTKVFRPQSQEAYQSARWRSMRYGESESIPWDEDLIPAPDITDRETLLELAKMTSNAYTSPSEKDWYPLGEQWNTSEPFGWDPENDGFRGHIFVSSTTPPTVVLSIKGTSAGVLGSGGPTSKKDKLNDNLLFSCCCARVDWKWTPVCDCYSGGWKCDQGCLMEALKEDSLFYSIGTNLYNNVTYLYPDANIWIIGHSLGGSLSALLGLTFGVPVVALEAPGERMASTRLHLPLPPADEHITHLYHTADPIPMGVCNGVLSTCNTAGFAMESRCHNGLAIVYDTVGRDGWSVDIRTHRIGTIIERVLAQDWEVGKPVPDAAREEDCVDCFKWEFGDFKNDTTPGRRRRMGINEASPGCFN